MTPGPRSSGPLPFGDWGFSCLYSGVAGFVDTAGFVVLAGLFTAHVTGNLVLAGAAVGTRDGSAVLTRLLMIPNFMIGVAMAALMVDAARRGAASPARRLLMAQAVGLMVFLAAGLMVESGHLRATALPTESVVLVGGIGVVAMAFQNAFMREIVPAFPASTVMTGNLTQVTLDLVRAIRGAAPEARSRLHKQLPALTGFLAGAALSAFAILHLGFAARALPAALVALLAVRCPGTAAA